MKKKIVVGDVIKSNRFKHGYLDKEEVDDDLPNLKNIIMAGVEVEIDKGRRNWKSYYRNDESRAQAEFVVIEKGHTSSDGEGGSCYADYVVIQRLRKNGAFDPNGERLWFYTKGDISAENYIAMRELTVVRRMEPSFR